MNGWAEGRFDMNGWARGRFDTNEWARDRLTGMKAKWAKGQYV